MLLHFRPVPHQLVDTKVTVGALAESNWTAGTAQLLHHNDMLQVSQALSTMLFWHSDTVQSARSHFPPEIHITWIGARGAITRDTKSLTPSRNSPTVKSQSCAVFEAQASE